jgi:hypothetical protein
MFATAWWRFAAVMVLGLAAFNARAQYHSLTPFEVPGSYTMGLWDINNQGQIAGWAAFGSEEAGFTHESFILDSKTFSVTPFAGPSGALGTRLNGISDGGGVMVGSYTTEGSVFGVPQQVEQAFVYDGASFQTLAIPGAVQAEARGVSPDGRYVSGMYFTEDLGGFFVYDRSIASYILVPGQQLIVNGANASGVLAGTELQFTEDAVKWVPFFYSIPSETFSSYSRGSFGEIVAPRTVSDDGVVAGWFFQNDITYGFVDDGTWIETIALDGASNTYVQGINNAGWIVGTAEINGRTVGIIGALPIPEPGTYALFVIGLGLLCWRVRAARLRSGR